MDIEKMKKDIESLPVCIQLPVICWIFKQVRKELYKNGKNISS